MDAIEERKLADWITSYMEYTEESEPPKLFREWCAVSVIAAALQRKCWLEWGTTTFYPNLYIVLTAPAGKARKGTAMAPARKFIDKMGIPCAAEAVTREALIRTLKEAEDVTPMRNNMPPAIHSSLTVFSPELTVFLGYNNVQLMSDLTDWFDCSSKWTYRTKTAGTDDITGVYLNLIGATTPDLIRSTLPLDAIGGGLTSRIIFVFEERKGKIVPFPFFSAEMRRLEEALYYDIEKIHMLQGRYKVTKPFLEKWGDWYTSQEGVSPFKHNPTRAFDGYIERRPTQVLKLSMVMNASRCSDMNLDLCDLERAINLLERTEVKMPRAFGGIGMSQNSNLTYRVIEALCNSGGMTLPELLNHFIYDGSQNEIVTILNSLTTSKLVVSESSKAGVVYKATQLTSNFGMTKQSN